MPIYFTPKYVDKTMYHGGVKQYTNLGLLVPANIGLEQGRVFYCPGSERRWDAASIQLHGRVQPGGTSTGTWKTSRTRQPRIPTAHWPYATGVA